MKLSNPNIIRTSVLIGMMLIAACTRLLPHPANMTAVMAVALFGGAKFKNRSFAILVPLMIMLFSDIIMSFHWTTSFGFKSIGFYSLMPFVYSCIAITAIIGIYAGQKSNPLFIIGGSVISSTIFFLVTNAAVWQHSTLYAQNVSGLLMCYDAGVPFYRNQLFGDLFYNFLLFGSYALATRKYKVLAY